MDQQDFLHFLLSLTRELRERNPRWTRRLNDILVLVNNLVTVQVEVGVRKKPELIDECLRGDMTTL